MTWVAGHSWVLLLLSALAGFAFTWWWMVRKIRGRVPITKEVAAVAASSGAASSGAAGASAAGASAAGAGVAAGAATLAGGTAARELKWTSETPVAERPDVEAEGPAAGVGADAPTADPDAPEVNLDDSLIGAAELDGADVVINLAGEKDTYAGLIGEAMHVFDDQVIVISVPEDGNHILYAFKERYFEPRWRWLNNYAKELRAKFGLDFPAFVQKMERSSKLGLARREAIRRR